MIATCRSPAQTIWLIDVPPQMEASAIAAYTALLDVDERARASRFLNDHARRQYVIAHAALRLLLSRFSSISPADWRFEREPGGKPVVARSLGTHRLHFNISHTWGAAACAVSTLGPVGIDIENALRPQDIHFYRAVLSQAEFAELATMAGDAQTRHFYAIWTTKEAFAKAVGSGISEALSGLTIAAAESLPRLLPNNGNWFLHRIDAGINHQAAFATQCDAQFDVRRFSTAQALLEQTATS